jgi:hypothetical protein
MNRYRLRFVLGLVGVWALGSGLAAYATTMEVRVEQASPSRLATLERKAEERDRVVQQNQELMEILDEMISLVSPEVKEEAEEGLPELTKKSVFGQLAKLQKKAMLSDELAREAEKIRAQHEGLLEQVASLQRDLEIAKKEREEALEKIEPLKQEVQKWKERSAGLRETIGRLLLGEFEYYEVKAGETLQSIAANPLIYGDPSRALWLRQVNEGRVRRLDDLQPGEMLLIPRFPRTGSYEF